MWPFGWCPTRDAVLGLPGQAARRPKKQRRRRAETASSKQLPTHPCGSECRGSNSMAPAMIYSRLIRYGKSVSPLIMHWTRC